LKILFIGDIVGNPGRKAVKRALPVIKREYGVKFCIANGENSAGGAGITNIVADELYNYGIDVLTLGNHTWSKRNGISFIDNDKRITRPANYAPGIMGNGSTIIEGNDVSIGVINLQGRIYMDNVDCPFRAADKEVNYLKNFTKIIIVDFHAEATSEKNALAWYLDGKVSAVIGTHTHVQTSDERILPEGTAFITDVGMTGPYDGIIGVEKEAVIKKFLTGVPERFQVAKGRVQFNAVLLDINESSGKTVSIERISQVFDNIS